MSSTLKEYRRQAKAEAIEKRSQSGQLQPHPAPSPPVSEYHSTASVDGETEIGDSASQVNQLYFFMNQIANGTKRSSTCFLKYRSPITWYRQVQRQIVRFQSEHRFCFHDYRNKTCDSLKNMLFTSKNAENLIFATPSEGSGFLKSGMFRLIAHYRPMISP